MRLGSARNFHPWLVLSLLVGVGRCDVNPRPPELSARDENRVSISNLLESYCIIQVQYQGVLSVLRACVSVSEKQVKDGSNKSSFLALPFCIVHWIAHYAMADGLWMDSFRDCHSASAFILNPNGPIHGQQVANAGLTCSVSPDVGLSPRSPCLEIDYDGAGPLSS